MTDEQVAYRFTVSGRVQGVFFRASTAREAVRLGVRGHAVNLPDGCVEVLAVGEAAAVDELRRWLQRGPPKARVAQVECRNETVEEFAALTGFATG